MSIPVRAVLLSLATFNLAIGGCARSGSGALDEDTEQALAKAGQEAADAKATAEANADAIDDLTERVDEMGDVGDRVSVVEDALAGVTQDVADLDTRLDGIEADWPPRDDVVVIDDAAAAGFPAGVAANAEQGFAHVNTRLDIQSGRLDAVESQVVTIGTNIETTVIQVVQEAAADGSLVVDADLSFDPGTGVDPRLDPNDAYPEYGSAANLQDAVRALRWANQVKFTPPEADTRLGALARNYVQEALVALDGDVYDIIYGNLAIDLAPDVTVDGSPLDTYIQNAIVGDTTYLGDLFATNEFVTAVTNIVTSGVGNVIAANVTVDPTNLAATGYANAQEALESLYADVSAQALELADLEQQLVDIGAGGVVTDASNVTYANNGQATVRAALDDLYATLANAETIIGNGHYVTDGQLVNQAVLALDAALYAAEQAADDVETRLAALETDVVENTDAIAALRDGNDATFNAFLDARIQDAVNQLIQERLQPLEDAVAALENARNAYILGRSAQTSTGAFDFGGKQGIEAATEMCRQTFTDEPNAHFCSLEEIQSALSTSSYNTANLATWDNVATWTISGVHAFYSGGAYNAANDYNPGASSLTTSCNNFLYNSADVAKGTTVRVDVDYESFGVGGAGRVGDAYNVQPGAACSTALPVLCCR